MRLNISNILISMKKAWPSKCSSCNKTRFFSREIDAHNATINKIICFNCAAKRRGKSLAFSSIKLSELGITQLKDNQWSLIRKCGHASIHSTKKDALIAYKRLCIKCKNDNDAVKINKEKWLYVNGYDYRISDLGRLKNKYNRILKPILMGRVPNQMEGYILQTNRKKITLYKNQLIKEYFQK